MNALARHLFELPAQLGAIHLVVEAYQGHDAVIRKVALERAHSRPNAMSSEACPRACARSTISSGKQAQNGRTALNRSPS